MILKTVYHDLLIQFNPTEAQIQKFWSEIESAYSSPDRHYHNLQHIEFLLKNLIEVKSKIDHWNTLLFACFYHDIVYDTALKTNEEESAILASDRMKQLKITSDVIAHCERMIMATQSHAQHPDRDIMYFLDADLAILGTDEFTYKKYTNNIRKEFSIYSDAEFKNGRQKVLEHFLTTKRIYLTDEFYNKYQQAARFNLEAEMRSLK